MIQDLLNEMNFVVVLQLESIIILLIRRFHKEYRYPMLY